MADFGLRPMESRDLAEIHEIELELFSDSSWSLEQFRSELDQVPVTRHYVVATVADKVVGYAGLCALPPDVDVQTIAVTTEHHRQGIGTALFEALLEESIARGCSRMMLEVRHDNAPAIEMYQKYGFEKIAHRANYYGTGLDAIIMECADLNGGAR